MPVQLRFETGLTGDEYVTREGWRLASLACCPLHPHGGCDFARHGTYERRSPPGTHIARWYCRQGHCTFSLLPDHLAARFPGTLAAIEAVVIAVEQAPSLEAAADALRRDPVTLPSAVRWVRRRVVPVRRLLTILVGLLPQLLLGCTPLLGAFRARLGDAPVLPLLRELAHVQLPVLARPLGFRPPAASAANRRHRHQHGMGADPPRSVR